MKTGSHILAARLALTLLVVSPFAYQGLSAAEVKVPYETERLQQRADVSLTGFERDLREITTDYKSNIAISGDPNPDCVVRVFGCSSLQGMKIISNADENLKLERDKLKNAIEGIGKEDGWARRLEQVSINAMVEGFKNVWMAHLVNATWQIETLSKKTSEAIEKLAKERAEKLRALRARELPEAQYEAEEKRINADIARREQLEAEHSVTTYRAFEEQLLEVRSSLLRRAWALYGLLNTGSDESRDARKLRTLIYHRFEKNLGRLEYHELHQELLLSPGDSSMIDYFLNTPGSPDRFRVPSIVYEPPERLLRIGKELEPVESYRNATNDLEKAPQFGTTVLEQALESLAFRLQQEQKLRRRYNDALTRATERREQLAPVDEALVEIKSFLIELESVSGYLERARQPIEEREQAERLLREAESLLQVAIQRRGKAFRESHSKDLPFDDEPYQQAIAEAQRLVDQRRQELDEAGNDPEMGLMNVEEDMQAIQTLKELDELYWPRRWRNACNIDVALPWEFPDVNRGAQEVANDIDSVRVALIRFEIEATRKAERDLGLLREEVTELKSVNQKLLAEVAEIAQLRAYVARQVGIELKNNGAGGETGQVVTDDLSESSKVLQSMSRALTSANVASANSKLAYADPTSVLERVTASDGGLVQNKFAKPLVEKVRPEIKERFDTVSGKVSSVLGYAELGLKSLEIASATPSRKKTLSRDPAKIKLDDFGGSQLTRSFDYLLWVVGGAKKGIGYLPLAGAGVGELVGLMEAVTKQIKASAEDIEKSLLSDKALINQLGYPPEKKLYIRKDLSQVRGISYRDSEMTRVLLMLQARRAAQLLRTGDPRLVCYIDRTRGGNRQRCYRRDG